MAWPTEALLRPGPWLWTLLALEATRGRAPCKRLLPDALRAGSTVRVEVSLALVTFTRREPAGKEYRVVPHLGLCGLSCCSGFTWTRVRVVPVTLALKGLPLT